VSGSARLDIPAGAPVHVDYRKWTNGLRSQSEEHWQSDLFYLGADDHGSWLAMPTGTRQAKPSFGFDLGYPHVKLITEDGWSADICRPPDDRRLPVVYSDMINIQQWTRVDGGFHVTMIDLDLDVITWNDGSIMIDDEDEFADHQVSRSYPESAIVLAKAACADVHGRLQRGDEPFGSVASRWLAAVH
jgi:hypothetical protein